MKRIHSIDFLRVMFCLLITVYHYYCVFEQLPFMKYLGGIGRYGFLGVEAFFMISGFCISMNYKHKDVGVGDFLIKRISPWYVTYLFFVAINIFLQLIANANCITGKAVLDKPLNFFYVLTSILLIHNGWFMEQNSPYGSGAWFLDVLVLLYLIWILIKKISDGNNKRYIGLSITMMIIGWTCVYNEYNIPFLYNKSARGYLMFFIGVLMYEIYEKLDEKSGVFVSKSILVIYSACIVMEVFTKVFTGNTCLDDGIMFISVFVFPTMFFVTIYLLKNYKFKISSYMAKYTMSIYLSHALSYAAFDLVLKMIKIELDYSSLCVFLGILLVIIVESILVKHFIEDKLTKKVNSFISKKIYVRESIETK